jgi:hypothetical protein
MKTFVLCVVIVLLIAGCLYLYDSKLQSEKKAAAAEELFKDIDSEYKSFKLQAEAKISDFLLQINNTNQLILLRDERIKELEEKQIQTEKALANEKSKTKTLSPNELVTKISSRVGTEVRLTGLQTYDFTRSGAESTLNIFLSEEALGKSLGDQISVTKELVDKFTLCSGSVGKLQEALQLRGEELVKCEFAKDSAETAMNKWKREYQKSKWKKRAEGFGIGVLLVIVLQSISGSGK